MSTVSLELSVVEPDNESKKRNGVSTYSSISRYPMNGSRDFPAPMPNPVFRELSSKISEFCSPDIATAFQNVFRKERGRFGPLTQSTLRLMAITDGLCSLGQNPTTAFSGVVTGQAQNPKFRADGVGYKSDGRFLSGSIFSPFHAYAHSLWGDGQPMTMPIENVDLIIDFSRKNTFMDAASRAIVGSSPVDVSFAHDVRPDSWGAGWTLGNISLRTVGTITKEAGGLWIYEGVVRAYHDTYDGNKSTHRGLLGEEMTTVLRATQKTEYQIHIPGEIQVKVRGF